MVLGVYFELFKLSFGFGVNYYSFYLGANNFIEIILLEFYGELHSVLQVFILMILDMGWDFYLYLLVGRE